MRRGEGCFRVEGGDAAFRRLARQKAWGWVTKIAYPHIETLFLWL